MAAMFDSAANAHNTVTPMQPHEMEHIRKVYDEDVAKRKFNSIVSPREDAQMARSLDKHAVPCECVIELYELLWRWGHRDTEHRDFASNFGFAVPDTIVVMKGRIYAWYFISKRDGALLRKSEGSLTTSAIEKKLCSESRDLCAVWMPMASQFPEARCHSPHAEFFSTMKTRLFLSALRPTHSGILQAFVEPHGVSNFLVRTVQFRKQTSLCLRTNRSLLNQTKGALFDRAATFEGWAGLSSTSSRYRSHKHPHMEELILSAGETLNRRIEQERVRQMLFLGPTQHVALHFKVTKDHMLYFIYASVVSEKEVILQTRPQLLMGDACMTEPLPLAALLPGGTDKKAAPHEAPACASYRGRIAKMYSWKDRANDELDIDALFGAHFYGDGHTQRSRPGSMSARGPERHLVDDAPGARARSLSPSTSQGEQPATTAGGRARRPPSGRSAAQAPPTVLPRMGYSRPQVPQVPYHFQQLQHAVEEVGRYEYLPPFVGHESVKQPLVVPAYRLGDIAGFPPVPSRDGRPPPMPTSRTPPDATGEVDCGVGDGPETLRPSSAREPS